MCHRIALDAELVSKFFFFVIAYSDFYRSNLEGVEVGGAGWAGE